LPALVSRRLGKGLHCFGWPLRGRPVPQGPDGHVAYADDGVAEPGPDQIPAAAGEAAQVLEDEAQGTVGGILRAHARCISSPGREAVGIQGVGRELDDLPHPLVVCCLHHGVPVAGHGVGQQPAPVPVERIDAQCFRGPLRRPEELLVVFAQAAGG
jgi:hypothetical protein